MIEAARISDGSSPADEFLTALVSRRNFRDLGISRAADVAVRFEDFARTGNLLIPRELRELREGIWEIKVGKVRLPFFWLTEPYESRAVRLTHGFIKSTDKTPRGEMDRAVWVRREDHSS
jgi:phage-related protein